MSGSRRSGVSNQSVIFAKAPGKSGGKATDLKVAFILSLICLLVELIIMFHKHHFLSLLAILSVIAIFFLNYFDKFYIRFSLAVLAIAAIFDLVWVFVHTRVKNK